MSREHGTRAKYVVEKCRCEACKEANRAYSRQRDRASRRPDEVLRSPFVPAGEMRRHLLDLSAAGVGYKRAADAAGVARSSCFKVLRGQLTKVRRETADKVLAVTPTAAAPGAYVDATTTWELIDALLAQGVTKAAIGRAVHGPQARALQLRRDRVSKANADAVATFAREHLRPVESYDERLVRLRAEADDLERLFSEMADILEARQDQWRRQAACRPAGIPVGVFFVERGSTPDQAREVCAHCPVAGACLNDAIRSGQKHGVWGGTTPGERRKEVAA